MDRRRFLQLLGLGGAGLVFDPERLLWVPGQKTIFDLGTSVAEPLYGNMFVTPDWIVKDTLRILRNNGQVCTQYLELNFEAEFNRDYDASQTYATIG